MIANALRLASSRLTGLSPTIEGLANCVLDTRGAKSGTTTQLATTASSPLHKHDNLSPHGHPVAAPGTPTEQQEINDASPGV